MKVRKTLGGNEIMTSIDSYNTVTKVQSKPKIDLINVNAYANFAKIISSSSHDIEQIRIMTEWRTIQIQYYSFFIVGLSKYLQNDKTYVQLLHSPELQPSSSACLLGDTNFLLMEADILPSLKMIQFMGI